jgi:hypothetical protein
MGHTKRWWQRIVFRVTARNIAGSVFLFAYCFLKSRFDFPYFHTFHYRTTATSVLVGVLLASVSLS